MLISVVMSVYNAEDYLRESIDSILKQTYTAFEFIIIDDGSKDSSWEILNEYANKDQRIVLIRNSKNLGLPASLNKGIEQAKGKYIARQDADDKSIKNRFEKQIKYALDNPDIDIIGCNAYIIDINGDVVCENDSFSKIANHKVAVLNRKAILYHGSALLKKSTLLNVGLYDIRFYYSQDGELWLRLLTNNAKIYIVPKPLYEYRVLPVKTNKKYNAQSLYNTVKHMIYVDNSNVKDVEQRLMQINKLLATKNTPVEIPNYMAIYWKSMANTAYFNNRLSIFTSYKYLYKAYNENLSAFRRIDFFKLGFMYAIPKFIVTAVNKK